MRNELYSIHSDHIPNKQVADVRMVGLSDADKCYCKNKTKVRHRRATKSHFIMLYHLSSFLFWIITSPVVAWSSTSLHESKRRMETSVVHASEVTGDWEGHNACDEVVVVGCGVLGTSLCKQLLTSSKFSNTAVVGVTRTANNHASILASIHQVVQPSSHFELTTYNDLLSRNRKFKNVVFCAPPSGSDDYPSAVRDTMSHFWLGPSTGRFVFTSSGGVYGSGDSGEVVNETTPVVDPTSNPRYGRLIKAEQACLENGGCTLRLAGLYTLERGAHNYWLEGGLKAIGGREDGIINLLHYDDAAGACIAALTQSVERLKGKMFLISDGHPMTRKGICESAIKAARYKGKKIPPFEPGPDNSKGKIYDGSWSNVQLNWHPVHASFDQFMTESM
jgi:nucleoside-diphosphate-sugar epimerase